MFVFKVVQKDKNESVQEPSRLIFCLSPLSGTVKKYFVYEMTSTGFTNPRYNSSSLPSGLSLDYKTGRISGYPKYAGEYKFSVWAEEGSIKTNVLSVRIKIQAPPPETGFVDSSSRVKPRSTPKPPAIVSTPEIICKSIFQARVGEGFSEYLKCYGLSYPEYNAEGLPPGIKIDKKTGQIFGTPTAAGVFKTILYAKKGRRQTPRKTISFKVLPVKITDLKKAFVKGILNDFLVFSIKNSRFQFSQIQVKSLPPGLTFNHRTQSIGGSPSKVGSYVTKLRMYSLDGKFYSQEVEFTISEPSFKVKAEISIITSDAVILYFGKNKWSGTKPMRIPSISLFDESGKIHIGVAGVKWIKEKSICIYPPKMPYRSPSFKKDAKVLISQATSSPDLMDYEELNTFDGNIKKKSFWSNKNWSCFASILPQNLNIGSRLSVSQDNLLIGHAEVKKILNQNFEIEFVVKPKYSPEKNSKVTFRIFD
jgi:hypothetical protein